MAVIISDGMHEFESRLNDQFREGQNTEAVKKLKKLFSMFKSIGTGDYSYCFFLEYKNAV